MNTDCSLYDSHKWSQHKNQARGYPWDYPAFQLSFFIFKCNSWFWNNAFYISYFWVRSCLLVWFLAFSFFSLFFWWLGIDSQPSLAHEWGYWESCAVQAAFCCAVPTDLSVASVLYGPKSNLGDSSCRKEVAHKFWWLENRPHSHVTGATQRKQRT